MSAAAGPNPIQNGLAFYLDIGNRKSYKYRPGKTDHGVSDWYCFVNGTATYSAIYPNTEIIEIDSNGNETVLVTTGSDPQRGTFTVYAGRRYYGTNAIHLMVESAQHKLVPISFSGNYFGNYHTRYNPKTIYIYAPYEDISVNVYKNVTGGVSGTPTSTFTLSKGSSTTYTDSTQSQWVFFESDKPAIMSAGSGGDNHKLQPMANYVYKRRNNYNITVNGGGPATASSRVTYDANNLVLSLEIADGAGGDSTQGIGYEYLSDTFSFGNVLSDYMLVAPYANSIIDVSYWDGTDWVLGEQHSLSGTQTSPASAFRDGNQGFGVNGTQDSGSVTNLGSGATLWKFEGTQPFAVIINDSGDDEENLLGWMSDRTSRGNKITNNSDNEILDLSGSGNHANTRKFNKHNTTSRNKRLELDGSDDYIEGTLSSNFNPNNGCTLEGFIRRPATPPSWRTYFNIKPSSGNTPFFELRTSGATLDVGAVYYNGTNYETSYYTINSTDYYHMVATYDGSGNIKLYINGELYSTKTSVPAFAIGSAPIINIGRAYSGDRPTNIKVGSCKVYDTALTAAEVQQNFQALRGRFGL